MSTATVAGLFLIAMPLAFNASFALLAARFDYPDILRKPTVEVLDRFREGCNEPGAHVVASCETAVVSKRSPSVTMWTRISNVWTMEGEQVIRLPLAPEIGLALGALAAWLSRRREGA